MSHVKNVQAYGKLIGVCTGYGGKYNPGQQNLKLNAMRALLEKAQSSLHDVQLKHTAYKNTTNDREMAFEKVDRLASMIVFTLRAANAAPQTVSDARYYLRLITGRRAKQREAIVALEANDQPLEPTRTFAQKSYVARASNFGKLVQLVSTLPKYTPNEAELQIPALEKVANSLSGLIDAVSKARTAWVNARIKRNEVLYQGANAMVKNASWVRNYVRVVFGVSSEQYKPLTELRFTKPS